MISSSEASLAEQKAFKKQLDQTIDVFKNTVKPAAPEEKPTAEAAAEAGPPRPARILVRVPADVRIYINGEPTRQASEERLFISPPLPPGRTLGYDLRLETTREGKLLTRTERVEVPRRGDDGSEPGGPDGGSRGGPDAPRGRRGFRRRRRVKAPPRRRLPGAGPPYDDGNRCGGRPKAGRPFQGEFSCVYCSKAYWSARRRSPACWPGRPPGCPPRSLRSPVPGGCSSSPPSSPEAGNRRP